MILLDPQFVNMGATFHTNWFHYVGSAALPIDREGFVFLIGGTDKWYIR